MVLMFRAEAVRDLVVGCFEHTGAWFSSPNALSTAEFDSLLPMLYGECGASDPNSPFTVSRRRHLLRSGRFNGDGLERPFEFFCSLNSSLLEGLFLSP